MSEVKETVPIIESNHFIVLENYTKAEQAGSYQTEAELEKELIADLEAQGYEYLNYLRTHDALLANLREQIQGLNRVTFTDADRKSVV